MKIIYLLFSLSLFISCGTKKKSQTDPIKVSEVEVRDVAYPLAELKAFSKKNDPYTLKEIKVNGNILELTVSYSGGCEKHDFSLIGNPELSSDKISVRKVQLVHKANGDQCKALKQKTLKFSITPLADNYKRGTEVLLRFDNYEKGISYTYN